MEYTLKNEASGTTGGIRFDNEIGFPYSVQTMIESINFIWKVFGQDAPEDRKSVASVSLIMEDMDYVAFTTNDKIHMSTKYLGGFLGVMKAEFTGILYHEMTNVWQWGTSKKAPQRLTSGIADFVRLRSGYVPGHWVGPGKGDSWDEGNEVTARFRDYCDGLKSGFVADLNKKMKDGYSEEYFVDLLGKSVYYLWRVYKAKYATQFE